MIKVYCFYACLITVLFSCRKQEEVFSSDPNLVLEMPTQVKFDTLYEQVVYPSQKIRIYNRNQNGVTISQIRLAKGIASPYSILVNGNAGPVVNDMDVLGKDSLLLYITPSLGASNNNYPYASNDTLYFTFNGKQQYILLQATAISVLTIATGDINCNTIWSNAKPVLVKGAAKLPSGCSLTIQAGTKVLFEKGTSLQIEGTLLVSGSKSQRVNFTSVDAGQNPGYWKGILLNNGTITASYMNMANAEYGIQTMTTNTNSTITLDHIHAYDFSKSAFLLSNATCTIANALIQASVENLTMIGGLGTYIFEHCTWAGYSYDYQRNGSCLNLANFTGTSLSLNNSIIWGDKTNEVEMGTANNIQFNACIVKTTSTMVGTAIQKNIDPAFVSPTVRNFKLKSTSKAINAAQGSLWTDDLDGNLRQAPNDLGTYEYLP